MFDENDFNWREFVRKINFDEGDEDLGNASIDSDEYISESKGVTGDRRSKLLKRIYGKLQNIMAHLLKLRYSTSGDINIILHWIKEIDKSFRGPILEAIDKLSEKDKSREIEESILLCFMKAIVEYEDDMKKDNSLIPINRIIDESRCPWNSRELIYEHDILELLDKLPESPTYNYILINGVPSEDDK